MPKRNWIIAVARRRITYACVIEFQFCRMNRRSERASDRRRMQSRSDSATKTAPARGTSIELTGSQFLSTI